MKIETMKSYLQDSKSEKLPYGSGNEGLGITGSRGNGDFLSFNRKQRWVLQRETKNKPFLFFILY